MCVCVLVCLCVDVLWFFHFHIFFAFSFFLFSFNSIGYSKCILIPSQKRHTKWPWWNINHKNILSGGLLAHTHTIYCRTQTHFIFNFNKFVMINASKCVCIVPKCARQPIPILFPIHSTLWVHVKWMHTECGYTINVVDNTVFLRIKLNCLHCRQYKYKNTHWTISTWKERKRREKKN